MQPSCPQRLLLVLALTIQFTHYVSGFLAGAAVLPHGDFAFDPSILAGIGSGEAVDEAAALHEGSMVVARFIASLRPSLLLLVTPHGFGSSWDWSFYGNSELDGRALVGRDLTASFGSGTFPSYEVTLRAAGAPQLAQVAVDALQAAGENATLLKAWGDALPQPLHWGEVLPLELVRRAGGPLPRVLTVGAPLSRNHSSSIATRVRRTGRVLYDVLEQWSSESVVVVVSADLAHTHWANTSFGFSSQAQAFDTAMGHWAESLASEDLVGQKTLEIVDGILSCGYLGMVLLDGILSGAPAGSFVPVLRAKPVAPTYYGMMAAMFIGQRSAEEVDRIVV